MNEYLAVIRGGRNDPQEHLRIHVVQDSSSHRSCSRFVSRDSKLRIHSTLRIKQSAKPGRENIVDNSAITKGRSVPAIGIQPDLYNYVSYNEMPNHWTRSSIDRYRHRYGEGHRGKSTPVHQPLPIERKKYKKKKKKESLSQCSRNKQTPLESIFEIRRIAILINEGYGVKVQRFTEHCRSNEKRIITGE